MVCYLEVEQHEQLIALEAPLQVSLEVLGVPGRGAATAVLTVARPSGGDTTSISGDAKKAFTARGGRPFRKEEGEAPAEREHALELRVREQHVGINCRIAGTAAAAAAEQPRHELVERRAARRGRRRRARALQVVARDEEHRKRRLLRVLFREGILMRHIIARSLCLVVARDEAPRRLAHEHDDLHARHDAPYVARVDLGRARGVGVAKEGGRAVDAGRGEPCSVTTIR